MKLDPHLTFSTPDLDLTTAPLNLWYIYECIVLNRLSIFPYGHVPAYSSKTSTMLISFSSICSFWLGAREYLCSLLSLRIFLILPSISLLMCVIMSTTSAVTPTLLHQNSTQTCSLRTQPNPSAINPSLRSHPCQKPESHKTRVSICCSNVLANQIKSISFVRCQNATSHRKKRFCLCFLSPSQSWLLVFLSCHVYFGKINVRFLYLPFLQASLVTVIHLVSSVVDSVEKEGILLLLHCWLLSVCFSVWWVIISCPKCHFLDTYHIYRDREI